VLIAIHVDPDTVMEELAALHTVHAAVARRWTTDDILIMGDFNADSKYISRRRLDGVQLRRDTDTFRWLIDDDVDTTTADNDYTYDRSVSIACLRGGGAEGPGPRPPTNKGPPTKPFIFFSFVICVCFAFLIFRFYSLPLSDPKSAKSGPAAQRDKPTCVKLSRRRM